MPRRAFIVTESEAQAKFRGRKPETDYAKIVRLLEQRKIIKCSRVYGERVWHRDYLTSEQARREFKKKYRVIAVREDEPT